MNQAQRKTIAEILIRLSNTDDTDEFEALTSALEAFDEAKQKLIDAADAYAAVLEDIKQDIESEQNDEQEKFDNMPESLQQGDNGQEMERCIEQLESANSALDDAISTLRDEDSCLTESGHTEAQESITEAIEALGEI